MPQLNICRISQHVVLSITVWLHPLVCQQGIHAVRTQEVKFITLFANVTFWYPGAYGRKKSIVEAHLRYQLITVSSHRQNIVESSN